MKFVPDSVRFQGWSSEKCHARTVCSKRVINKYGRRTEYSGVVGSLHNKQYYFTTVRTSLYKYFCMDMDVYYKYLDFPCLDLACAI